MLKRLKARLLLSRAKHPSLRGHARLSRVVARHVPAYSFDAREFFTSDDAPPAVVERRRAGFAQLAQLLRARAPNTLRMSAEVEPSLSDLQFTSSYRVPLPYSRIVREELKTGAFTASSHGVMLTDL